MSIKTVYLICHAHYDVGGGENPTVSALKQRRYLDNALRLIEETRSYDEDARFKWSCEVSAPVLDYIEAADNLHKKAFLSHAASGALEVTGFAYHFDTMLGKAAGEANLGMLRREIWKALDIRTVVQNGVGGVSASAVDKACEKGIRYLWVGLDKKSPRVREVPALFTWKTSSAGHVLTWINDGFGTFNEMLCGRDERLISEKLFDTQPENLRKCAKNLCDALKQYEVCLPKASVVPVSFTGGYGENDEAGFALLPDFVRAWNGAGLKPRLCIATFSEAFDALQTNLGLSGMPTFSGEWSSFTSRDRLSVPSAVFSARETERFVEAMHLIPSYDKATAVPEEKEIGKNLCVFCENSCCGAAGSYEHKIDALYAAEATAKLLYNDQVRLYFNSCNDNRFYVYNTTSVPFADYIRIPKTKFIARHSAYVDENTGSVGKLEYDGGDVLLWVELSPNTLKTFHLSDRAYTKSYNGDPVRIQTDALGYPVSFRWLSSALNLPAAGDLMTRNVFLGDAQKTAEELRTIRDSAEREALIERTTSVTESLYSFAQRSETNHTVVFTQTFSHPSLLFGRRTMTVWKNTPRVSVCLDLDKRLNNDPEMMFVKFDLGKTVNTATASLGGQAFELARGQLFTACNDFVTFDGWLAFPYEHILFCSKDSPVASFENEHFFEANPDKTRRYMPLYSYVYNGFVSDKYPAAFSGKLSLRYDILLTPEAENDKAAQKIYEGLYLPPMTYNTFRNNTEL